MKIAIGSDHNGFNMKEAIKATYRMKIINLSIMDVIRVMPLIILMLLSR